VDAPAKGFVGHRHTILTSHSMMRMAGS
jgi:hypothetical protein